MSVRLRLSRAGTKKSPFYHVVVADQRKPRDGAFIEQVGTYDPRVSPAIVKLQDERIDHWVRRGAQASEAVADIIRVAKRQPAAPAAPAKR